MTAAVAERVETGTPNSVVVHVIGKCPVKGCKNRRRNTLTGRIATARQPTWTSVGIPTEFGEQHLNPFQGRWALEKISVTRSALGCFRIQGGPDVDPRQSPTLSTSQVIRRRADLLVYTESMYALGWVCEDHDRYMKLGVVSGVVDIDRGCDGRCESATGPNCECSCGGRNHGAAHDFLDRLKEPR